MNNVKLLHIKCCFFKFFSSPVALKSYKILAPQEKVEMMPLVLVTNLCFQSISDENILYLQVAMYERRSLTMEKTHSNCHIQDHWKFLFPF